MLTPINTKSLRRSINTSTLTKVDDDAEREKRKNLARRQNINYSLNSTPLTPGDDSGLSLGQEEVEKYVKGCIKLFVENKISSKNVWNIKIIDFLHKSKLSLPVAGTSLDVCSKVYTIRVDDTHSDTIKLAGNFAVPVPNTSKDPNGDNLDESNKENDNANKKKQPKKKSTKKYFPGEKATISKNNSTLQECVKKLEPNYFQSMQENNSGPISSLFTNTCSTDPTGLKFLIKDKSKEWISHDIDSKLENAKIFPFSLPKVENFKMCEVFSDYDMLTIDPGEHSQIDESVVLGKDIVFDENQIPIAELDASVNNLFDNINDSDVEEPMGIIEEEEMVCHDHNYQKPHLANIINRPSALRESEYSYNGFYSSKSGKIFDSVWAGPSHWKLKYIKPAAPRFSGRVPKQPIKQKQKKAPETPIDFENLEEIALTKKSKRLKRPKVDNAKISLPQYDFNVTKIVKIEKHNLMSKPRVTFLKNEEQGMSDDEGTGGADEVFHNGVHVEDNDLIDMQDVANDDDGAFTNVEVMGDLEGDNLVEAPEMVQKNHIRFAQRAKRINMKKLKDSMWTIIDTKLNSKVAQNNGAQERADVKFSDIYSKLHDILPMKMTSELSCPIAFFSLLQLANDHSLGIADNDDKSELIIQRTL